MRKFESEVDASDVANGECNSEILWVCDIRWTDFNNKPIRRVVPTRALVCDNSQTKKRIYYSASHFVALNDKGEMLRSKIIPLCDNTGFRSRAGVPLRVFREERDCVMAFSDMSAEIRQRLKSYKKECVKRINDMDRDIFETSSSFLIGLGK